MIKKRITADDIEMKLRRMGARKVADDKFRTAPEYSAIYHSVVESFEKKNGAARAVRIPRKASAERKKDRV